MIADQQCPFLGKRCYKVRKSNPEISIGSCTVPYGREPEPLARGLAVFLNTTAVDEHFRRFNGHTQINATDLKPMEYPSRDALIQLGEWASQQGTLAQDQIDAKLASLTG